MDKTDEEILQYFAETNAAWTASGMALNIKSDLSYGAIRFRLKKLEEHDFVRKPKPDWGYYELSKIGRSYLMGTLELDDENIEPVKEERKDEPKISEGNSKSVFPPEGDPDIESLRVTRDEAREVINLQIDTIRNIDDKAAYTLRLNIIIVGVLLTIASLLVGDGPTPGLERFPLQSMVVGFLFSALSFIFSLWTYTSTKNETGPGPSDLNRLRSYQYEEKRWLKVLLKAYAYWMKENEKVNRRDSLALFLAHIFLFMGIGYYAFTIVWGIWLYNWPDIVLTVSLAVLLVLLPVIVILPRIPYVEPITDRIWARAEPLWKALYNN